MIAPRRGRGSALARGGDGPAAVTELRAALALARGTHETDALARDLITVAVAVGDIEAEVVARRAWVRTRPSANAMFDLSLALGRSGHPAEAADILAGGSGFVPRSDDDRARWALAEGNFRVAAGDPDGAALVLERARRRIRSASGELRSELWAKSIEIARRRGVLDDIKAELAHPRDSIEWMARTSVAEEGGDLRGAWTALDEAIRRLPRHVELHRRRIDVARRIGTAMELVRLYQEMFEAVAKGASADSAVVVETLDGLWRLRRADVAGRIFDRVFASRGSGGATYRALAEVAGRWGDDSRAERGWMALLRREPRNEVAIIALGELRFQRGQRRSALDTWRLLLRRGAGPAESHARLAEILGDHDFRDEALVSARAAIALSPGGARYRRLLATILERHGRSRDAEGEWEAVLDLSRGPAHASERQEARSRLIAIWVREGIVRVDKQVRELERAIGQDGPEREALTFLVETLLRVGRTDAAIAVMKGALSGNDGASPVAAPGSPLETPDAPPNSGVPRGASPSAGPRGPRARASSPSTWSPGGSAPLPTAMADLVVLLVRSLRQVGRSDEAKYWLEELSRQFPERAAETDLQLVDIAFAGYEDQRAHLFVERVAADAPGNQRVVMRLGEVQERLGRLDQASATYRRLIHTDRDSSATLALAALLVRTGEVDEPRALLRQALRDAVDDEILAEVGRRAILLEEAGGTLEELERYLAGSVDLNVGAPGGQARRRVLASLLLRLVPPAYRKQRDDAASMANLRRFARQGLRPLIDLVSEPDAEADARAIEVLGMLGLAEAIPHLARVVVPDIGATDSSPRSASHPPAYSRDDLDSVVLIALGRLGDERARPAVYAVAKQARPTLKLPLLWALGRVGGPVAVQMARDEIALGATDAAVVACLSLGRVGGPGDELLLKTVVRNPARPEPVRVAAVFGLALGRHAAAMPVLFELAGTDDSVLATAARTALTILRSDGVGAGGASDCVAVDEAVAIFGGHIDSDALLRALQGSCPRILDATKQDAR